MQQDQLRKHSGSSRRSWCQRTIGNCRNIHHKCSTHRVFAAAAARWGTLGFGTKNKIRRRRKRKMMPLMKYRYVFSGRSGLTSNCVVMVALPSNQMDSFFGTKVGATPLMILICTLYQTLSLGVQYRTRRCISYSPGGVSKLDCSTTRRVPIPNDASSESSRRNVSNAILFGARTIPTVEISTSSGQTSIQEGAVSPRAYTMPRKRLLTATTWPYART